MNLAANVWADLRGTGFIVNNDLAGDNVNLEANSSAYVYGSGGHIGIAGLNVQLNASGENIDTVAGASFNLSGSYDRVNLGSNTSLGLLAGIGSVVTGNDDQIATLAGTSFELFGSRDTINLAVTGGSAQVTFDSGSKDEMVYANGSSISAQGNTSFNLSGSDDRVDLATNGGSSCLGVLSGHNIDIYGDHSTINTLPGTSLNLHGSTTRSGLP